MRLVVALCFMTLGMCTCRGSGYHNLCPIFQTGLGMRLVAMETLVIFGSGYEPIPSFMEACCLTEI